jgi:hypothetical protein
MIKTDAGLIVPDDAITKSREVWTADEARLMRRAITLLGQHNIRAFLCCQFCQGTKEQLQQAAIIMPADRDDAGHLIWSCGHADRIMGDR